MTGPLAAVRDFFIAPPDRVARPAAAPAAVPPSFAVLGEGRPAVAVASGLVLARGGGCGLLCVWPPGEAVGPRVPAAAGARRLAGRLAARGIAAATSGRLARVLLPAAPAEAVAAAQRAVAAAAVPAAVALTGARDRDLDAVLALQDAVVLVIPPGSDGALARLAEGGLAGLAPPVVRVAPPAGLARELAASGLLAAPALRARLRPALEAVP